MTASAGAPLLRLALEGQRIRKAAATLERVGPKLINALRRSVPFLSRRGVGITLTPVRAVPLAELLGTLAKPVHTSKLVVQPGFSAGALFIDAGAASLFLDGVLGGDGQSLPDLNAGGLSGPQSALIAGLSANIVRAFSATFAAALGLSLEPAQGSAGDDHRDESAPLACVLELADGAGHVVLVLGKEAVLPPGAEPASLAAPAENPRIANVLADVELLLVVELGRVPLRVGQLAALKVGDTLRLDVPVNGLVSVRADGHELMRGRPTSSGGRIAVNIIPSAPGHARRHDS